MDFPLKISIITATYNSAATVRDTLESVRRQSYGNIEHIIIDGASSDTTLDIVKEFPHVSKVISEPDKGIYDAMNKGVDLATGDIVGILNSDDFFPVDDVVEQIAQKFQNNTDLDATIGDVNFVQPKNLSKIIRHYSASKFNINRFEYGFMPPHPSFYVKKSCYQSFGTYQVDYHIASDYELLIRFLYVNKLTFEYIPKIIVTMRAGGVSNEGIKSRYILNKEIVRACKENGIKTSMLKLSFKYFTKVFEYIQPLKRK